MLKKLIPLLVFLSLLLLGYLGYELLNKPLDGSSLFIGSGPRIGQVAPLTTGQDLDGNPLSLQQYRGKVVVLNFWSFG